MHLALSLTSSDERDRFSLGGSARSICVPVEAYVVPHYTGLETFIAALANFTYVEDKGEQVLTEDDPSLDFFFRLDVPIMLKHSGTVCMDDGTVRRDTSLFIRWDSPPYQQFGGSGNQIWCDRRVVVSQPSPEP